MIIEKIKKIKKTINKSISSQLRLRVIILNEKIVDVAKDLGLIYSTA